MVRFNSVSFENVFCFSALLSQRSCNFIIMPLGVDFDQTNESQDFMADLSQAGNVAFLKSLIRTLAQKNPNYFEYDDVLA